MNAAGELKRELGVSAAIAIVVGTTIGSGIFLVPRAMVAEMGSPAMVMLVWVVGGLLSMFGALTYAGFATRFPDAGGEFVYLREMYGPFWAFTYGWLQTWVARPGAIATLATAFFSYLAFFVPELESTIATVPLPIGPGWQPLQIRSGQLLAIAVIILLGFLNARGVRAGSLFQISATAVKVLLIALVIAAGLFAGGGTVANFSSTTKPAADVPFMSHFFAALVAALWAYDGWNTVVMVGSEIKDPNRNFPRALIGGMGLIIAIYLLANIAYFFVLNAGEVAASTRVAADMMKRVAGEWGGSFVSLAAIVSIAAATNGTLLGASRIPYAMARAGLFFPSIGEIHPENLTPSRSIWMLTAVSSVLVLSGQYEELFTSVVFASWILYAMTAAGAFVLERKARLSGSPTLRVPGYPWTPGLFVFTAIILLGATLMRSPRESLFGLVTIAIGVPFYRHWRRNGARNSSL